MDNTRLINEAWVLCSRLHTEIYSLTKPARLQRLYPAHEKALKRFYRRTGKQLINSLCDGYT